MMRRPNSQAGFALPELLVGIAMILVVGFATLGVLQSLAHALASRSSGQNGTIALEHQLDTMRGDAASAYAVFVPQRDVNRQPNAPAPAVGAPPPQGHEVDFYAKTDAGSESWWAYTYDAASQTLQRYDYDPNTGSVGVANRQTGAIDTQARYPAITGVLAFSARVLEAGDLTGRYNAFAPLISSLLDKSGMAPASLPVGFVPADGKTRTDLYGGNTTIEVDVRTARGARTLHLTTATMPSGFVIHQLPSIRAVTYRIDVVHRSWFGLAQKTHAQIFNQLQYSYVPNATGVGNKRNQWHVWCDWELYGYGIAGMSLNDPAVTYNPRAWNESAAGIYYQVVNDGTRNLNEQPGCHGPIPGPSATPAPVASSSNPDTIDTPPPCFSAGQCWPYNAPSNWAPASPWPSQTPPATWCATHAESTLCGGTGQGAPPSPVPPGEAFPTPSYGTPTPVATDAPPNDGSETPPPPRRGKILNL